MTRLFREVEVVEGASEEPMDYAGVHPLLWQKVCRGKMRDPEVGFVEVGYTTEDVAKLHQRIQELEALVNSLHVSRAVLVD